ncbi:polymorphic toxin type 30 domain-containing protein [Streptomyces sp. NPDC127077]|uniref:polymorphic toxin type 30 domain-containing protein n=1 Tax=Streptomyces sp. NPDC127077 TaxID=3347131 RepID=UPI003652F32E
MPVAAAALLVGLLPAQSLAVPPDPATAETGRATLDLTDLERDLPVPSKTTDRRVDTLRADVPKDLLAAPSSTVTPPSSLSDLVTFGGTAATTTSARASSAAASPAALRPVGKLPVSLGQAPDQPAPSGTWQVTIPDRTEPVSQGVDGTVLVVQSPATGSVPVSVKLDYSKFKSLYGADWASRLRFVQFPDCYLTTPDDEACQAYEELETANDPASQSLTATVDPAAQDTVTPAAASSAATKRSGVAQAAYRTSSATPAVAGGTAVVGAVDSGGGAGGSFKATPLASDGKWAAGGSSGGFSWSYPLITPPASAGPAPKVSFEYSSQAVDGRTAVSSPQASWIGEGWSYDPGHIERRYRTCKDDTKTLDAGTPNNTAKKDKTSDLCWVSYNAVMSLGGRTTELVRDAAPGSKPETDTEVYRPQQDDGTRVEHRTGASNDDNNGEYWVVTTADGTQYFYGQNSVGGGHADTHSVSTVPVFGNHPGEPCHADTFADSRCGSGKQQAWYWGLDKVVDVNGNTMVVNWQQETNNYAVKKRFKSPEQYDRNAYPTTIEYGMRSDLTKPSATVDFGAKQRCLKSETACDAANFTKTGDPGAYRPWWDTPGNLNCKSTSKLCAPFPSFWTQLRLDTVTTKAARPGQSGLGPVDKYTLRQSFPEDWYDTSPGLWLNSITRTGYAPGDTTGTLQSADGISFAPYTVGADSPLRARLKDQQLPNLVLNGNNDPRPGFTRPRIGTVSTENGGDIEVEYTGGCPSPPEDDKGKANETCYPVRWSPDGDEKTPAKAWFNKYVVDSVTENDKVTSHGEPVFTKYAYQGAAWAKSDDEFTRPALRTYSDWHGYRQVTATKGSSESSSEEGALQPQSYTLTRYFQGAGGTVKDSTGTHTLLADDGPQYAGMTAETITYRDADRKILKRSLSFPWSKQTASRSRENEDGTAQEPLLAYRTGIKRSDEIQSVDSSWRAVRTLTSVDDTYGLPIQVETSVVKPNGSGETLSDQSCTKNSYVHNTTIWLIGLPKEQRTMATSCADYDTADPATKLQGAAQTAYDNLAYGATPTKGQVTSTAQNNGAGTGYAAAVTTTYDPLGRVRTVTAPGLGTTEKQYTPGDSGGPVTSVKAIDNMNHAMVTTYDPGRNLPLTVTDANNRVERSEFDALGRLVRGFSSSRSSGGKSPDVEISYQTAIATSKVMRPAAVTVKSLKDDGSYSRQVTLYDGLARPVQTQSEAHGPGRIIADTTYNDHGLVNEQTSAYLAVGEPGTDLFTPRSKSFIPSWTKHRYDGLEREVRASVYQGGDYKYATYTTYNDTSTWVNPPGSTTPTTLTSFDALGRVASVKHYTTTDSSVSTGRTTTYEYDARGNRIRATDPAGNVWSYTYDARGRMTSATDPDTGTTDTWYDDADRPNRVRNARQQETFTEYDVLGRVVKVRQGSATATPVQEYTYDSLPGAIGLPVSSIRHTANGDYINRVTGYDTEYRATGTETVIPANSMTTGLSGTYAYSYTYTPTGAQQSVTLPAVGGLASERVISRYDSDGLPESTSGQTWYTADATYSPYGEPLRTVSGSQPNRVWTTNFVDPHTGRLQRTVADRETASPHRIADSFYSYDASGTITSNARQLGDPADGTWDNQCYTYDALGELVHAWTSKTTPDGNGTGCKAANGTTWGHRTSYATSSGPVAEAPDDAGDVTSPNASLTSTLAAAAPDTATVSTGATAYRQSFTFDWLGNRATHTEHDTADPSKNVSFTYRYGKTVTGNGTTPSYLKQPHTATSISSTPTGKGSVYTFDDSGNTTLRDLANTTQNLAWTSENKLDTITDDGKKTTYVYDAAGNRILENSSTGSTLYLGETEVTTNTSGAITLASRSYGQAGAPTVVRTATNGATTGHKLSALIADPLGTANTSVELSTGQTVTRRAFKPYGETRGAKPANWPNKRSYLGSGIDDAATGLTHLGARDYDQNSGRFLSADPVIDLADPLQMNGYTYADNNPVAHSDPSGLCMADICGIGYPIGGTGSNGGDKQYVTTAPQHAGGVNVAGSSGAGYTGDLPTAAHGDSNQLVRIKNEWYLTIYPGIFLPAHHPQSDSIAAEIRSEMEKTCAGFDYYCVAPRKDANGIDMGAQARFVAKARACPKSCHGGDLWLTPAAVIEAMMASATLGNSNSVSSYTSQRKGGTRSVSGRKIDCKCFLAGTDVLLADGSTKDIEDIKLGEKVLATDPKTGITGPRRVTRLIRTEGDKHFNELSIATENGIEKLTATHGHPLWSPSQRDWIAAGALKPGMTLRTNTGHTVIVTGNRPFTKHTRTYNLTVDGLHTYYVLAGETAILVHNSNCGGYDLRGRDPMSIVPDNASVRQLRPDPNGGAQYGIEFKWKNADGIVVRLRIHGPDGRAPAGSNSANGETYRVQIGNQYQDESGNLYHRQVHNPDSPNHNADAANDTHIPWPSQFPGL